MYIYYMGHHYYRRNSLNNLYMIEFQIIYYELLLQHAITTHDPSWVTHSWSCSYLLSILTSPVGQLKQIQNVHSLRICPITNVLSQNLECSDLLSILTSPVGQLKNTFASNLSNYKCTKPEFRMLRFTLHSDITCGSTEKYIRFEFVQLQMY